MLLWVSLALASWPDRTGEVLPVLGHEVQWVDAWDELAAPLYEVDGKSGYIARDRWEQIGIRAEGWWVLPEDGSAAVPSRVTAVRYASPGECGGYMGIAVELDGPRSWAAVMGTPPNSWHEPVSGPDFATARQLDAWFANHPAPPENDYSELLSWAAAEDIAVVRVTQMDADTAEGPDTFGDLHRERDLRIDANGVHETAQRRYHQYAPALTVRALRDVDGDGVLDRIEGECQRVITSLDGTWRVASIQNVCCGC